MVAFAAPAFVHLECLTALFDRGPFHIPANLERHELIDSMRA